MMNGRDDFDDEEEDLHTDDVERGPNGLPKQWSELKNMGGDPWSLDKKLVVFAIVETVIGIGIAFLIYKFSPEAEKTKYDARIAGIGANDLGYVYFIPFTYWLAKAIMTGIAVKYRAVAGVDAPNQQVYKVFMRADLPYVMLEDDGYAGKFNRAQRALSNLGEYLPEMLVINLLGGYVFPIPMLILCVLYCLLRLMYTCMYTEKPAGRGAGFVLSQHLVAPAMTGLVFWAALVSFIGPL